MFVGDVSIRKVSGGGGEMVREMGVLDEKLLIWLLCEERTHYFSLTTGRRKPKFVLSAVMNFQKVIKSTFYFTLTTGQTYFTFFIGS